MSAIAPHPWHKTPAFWLALLAAVCAAVLASGLFASDSAYQKIVGIASSVLGMFGFTASRSDVQHAWRIPAPQQSPADFRTADDLPAPLTGSPSSTPTPAPAEATTSAVPAAEKSA